MKPGSPFKCTTCGATLKWSDAPVIECEYCHTKILMKDLAARTQMGYRAPNATGRKGMNPAVLVVVAAILVGVVIIVVKTRSGGGTQKTPSPAATAPTPTPPAVPPREPAKPAEPPSTGKKVLEFGQAGTNAGQLDRAFAIAVVPSGEIVVADARSGRAQVFDATGAYQRVITLPPSALTKELSVFGAGATPDNKVIVSRAGDLLVLDVKAGTVEKTIRGSYPEVFYHGDVEVAQDGSIYAVTDRTGDLSVMHLSAAGKVLGKTTKAGQNVAIDGVGTMFLSKRDVIEVRDAKGEVQRKFSQAGSTTISRSGPIAFDGKHVLVAESNKVYVFSPDGAFLAELETPSINDIALDRAGALYVLSSDHVTKYELTLPN